MCLCGSAVVVREEVYNLMKCWFLSISRRVTVYQIHQCPVQWVSHLQMLLNRHMDCFAKVCSLYILIILAPTCNERLSNSPHQILEGYVGHLASSLPPRGVEATVSICNVGL